MAKQMERQQEELTMPWPYLTLGTPQAPDAAKAFQTGRDASVVLSWCHVACVITLKSAAQVAKCCVHERRVAGSKPNIALEGHVDA